MANIQTKTELMTINMDTNYNIYLHYYNDYSE